MLKVIESHVKDLSPKKSGLEPQWIEAPYLIKRQGYYYLVENWYAGCDGADSTYQIRVGRNRLVGETVSR